MAIRIRSYSDSTLAIEAVMKDRVVAGVFGSLSLLGNTLR